METEERSELEKRWRTEVPRGMNKLAVTIAAWRRDKGFRTDWGNVSEKLMLVVTELAEAMEAYREIPLDGSNHPVLTLEQMVFFNNFAEELADAHIRLFDLSASLFIDIEHAIVHKMTLNSMRPFRHGKEC